MKLLATRIVANNFFGLSNKTEIICIAPDLFSRPSLTLVLVNENRATSAPDIKAEQTRSIISKKILVIKDVSTTNTYENKTVGSGSNRN